MTHFWKNPFYKQCFPHPGIEKKSCVKNYKVKLKYKVEIIYHMEVDVCLLGLVAPQESTKCMDESPE